MDDGSATLEKLSCKRSKYARVQLTARRENSKTFLRSAENLLPDPRAFKLGGGALERD